MPDQLQLRGGTTAEHSAFVGAPREVTVDTIKKAVVVHDGVTAGGVPALPTTGGVMTGPLGIGADPAAAHAAADDFVIGGAGNRGLTIQADGGVAAIHLTATLGAVAGAIQYDPVNNRLSINVAAVEAVDVRSDGRVGLGVDPTSFNAAADDLVIGGNAGNRGMTIFSGDAVAGIHFTPSPGVVKGALQYDTTTNTMSITVDGAARWSIGSVGHLLPATDNACDLGAASYRAREIFAASGTINTSDQTLKTAPRALAAAELRAWERIEWSVYKWLAAVAAKGEAARDHVGAIAQQVSAAFAAEGLDASRYGLFCRDPVVERVAEAVTVERQATAPATRPVERIEVIDGTAVLTVVEETIEEPLWEDLPVVDVVGQPVLDNKGRPRMHRRPVMTTAVETRLAERPLLDAAGAPVERLGLRYTECLAFEAAWLRAELAAVKSRLAAGSL